MWYNQNICFCSQKLIFVKLLSAFTLASLIVLNYVRLFFLFFFVVVVCVIVVFITSFSSRSQRDFTIFRSFFNSMCNVHFNSVSLSVCAYVCVLILCLRSRFLCLFVFYGYILHCTFPSLIYPACISIEVDQKSYSHTACNICNTHHTKKNTNNCWCRIM